MGQQKMFQAEIRFGTLTSAGLRFSMRCVNEEYENSLQGQSIKDAEGEEESHGSCNYGV